MESESSLLEHGLTFMTFASNKTAVEVSLCDIGGYLIRQCTEHRGGYLVVVGDGLGEIPTLLSLGQGSEIPLPLASGLRGKCAVVASAVSAFIWGFSFVETLLPTLSTWSGWSSPNPRCQGWRCDLDN